MEERNSHPQKDEPRRRELSQKISFRGNWREEVIQGLVKVKRWILQENILEEEKAPAWKRAKIAQ